MKRKVFILNTHLGNIIGSAGLFIKKLENIISFFEEYRDALLIWRPHPLSIETAKAMNPIVSKAYAEIVDRCKNSANMIYDDTSDLHRTLALSDAYIGDAASSVSALYKYTKKPMFLTDINRIEVVPSDNFGKCLTFACAAVLDNYLWAPADTFNGLFRIDLKSAKAEYMGEFLEEDRKAASLFQRVLVYRKLLFFIPYSASCLVSYDCDTNQMKRYPLDDYGEKDGSFNDAFIADQKIFLFSGRKDAIVIFDIQTENSSCFKNCMKKAALSKGTAEGHFSSGTVDGERIIVTYLSTPSYLVFHPVDMTYEECEITNINSGLSGVVCKEHKMYFLTLEGEVVVCEEGSEEGSILWKYEGKVPGTPFSRIVLYKDMLWLVPCLAEEIIRIEISTGRSEKLSAFSDEFKWNAEYKDNVKYSDIYVNGPWLILYPRLISQMLMINMETSDIKEMIVTLPEEWQWNNVSFLKYIDAENNENDIPRIYNERYCRLYDFVETVCKTEAEKESRNFDAQEETTCGSKIWDYVKQNYLTK